MSTNNPPPTKQIPKDGQVIISILKDMGIMDFEPQAITQLLEFTYSKLEFFSINFLKEFKNSRIYYNFSRICHQYFRRC